MATIKFYTDEHVAKVVANGRRQRGVDVLTVAEAGLLGASDEEHITWHAIKAVCFLRRTMTFYDCMRQGLNIQELCMHLKAHRSAA